MTNGKPRDDCEAVTSPPSPRSPRYAAVRPRPRGRRASVDFWYRPFVPGAVHLALALHVADIDDRGEDLALVRAAQLKALVDVRQRFHALLIHRGSDGIRRDRDSEH